MQWKGEFREQMTYISPASGDPVGVSFLQPRSKEDLIRRRIMMSLWAEMHHGFLGRAPDYMNTALMAFSSAAELLSEQDPRYADNMRNYYIYCRENDITLSHAFVQPHIGRFSTCLQTLEEPDAAKVIEKSEVTHQILCRTIAKTEFLLGTIEYIVSVLGLNSHAHIIEKVSEVITVLETMKSLLLAAEEKAFTDSWGTVIPDPDIMFTANFIFPRVYPRIIEILQLIGASGLIMLPREEDFYAEYPMTSINT